MKQVKEEDDEHIIFRRRGETDDVYNKAQNKEHT